VEEFEPRRIAVGRDMHLSAPAMADAVMRGAAELLGVTGATPEHW